jgi:hypothetical protein
VISSIDLDMTATFPRSRKCFASRRASSSPALGPRRIDVSACSGLILASLGIYGRSAGLSRVDGILFAGLSLLFLLIAPYRKKLMKFRRMESRISDITAHQPLRGPLALIFDSYHVCLLDDACLAKA